jgi:LPS-assembly lipoprotein
MPARIAHLAVAVLVAVMLSACGFEPLLGDRGRPGVTAELATIRVAPIADNTGRLLRNALLDRLVPRGEMARPRYLLEVRVTEPRQPSALRRDDLISRFSHSVQATFRLVDTNGKTVVSGTSSFTTDYEVTNSEYANVTSRDNARDRIVELIGDDIRSQLAAFLRDRAPGAL